MNDGTPLGNWFETLKHSRYDIGEIVAIAQSYENLANGGYLDTMTTPADNAVGFEFKPEYCGAGWKNKMFVKADLMPHRIRITDIKAERLQEINDEDCIKEGILEMYDAWYEPQVIETVVGSDVAFVDPFGFDDEHNEIFRNYPTPREAFADLIDRVSGKGAWESNPWVFAYTFELVKGGKE